MLEDSEIHEGDVWIELVDGIPSITFFDRVKDFIERKMAKMIIIKLLERKIAFNSLLNRVTMLWKTKCPFQLMDLENYYYLDHFNDEEDYYKAIGSVVKIDKNTDSTKRGRFPRMAISALWSWVDLCQKDLFPLLMKETSVKIPMPMPKIQGRSLGGKSSDNQGSLGGDSRFDVLGENQGWTEVEEANMVRELSIEKGTIKGTSNGRNPKVAAAYIRNDSKVKGKGILVASGPKVGVNVLKPVKKGIQRSPINFNDGAIIGRRAGEVNASPFHFQTIQVLGGLDSNSLIVNSMAMEGVDVAEACNIQANC
ncbi:hypothetical protein GOBAR_AA14246 [Gossypium barbadense]|uniref:DUF4283 domain-containing protein n=1 Tax=Gossypium barbadense TaxID=3634 RepID=A0A2P5XSW0_GOSBA|nr:hypothetical protein GOBAR_AA14246 [Gossypium barbadense]